MSEVLFPTSKVNLAAFSDVVFHRLVGVSESLFSTASVLHQSDPHAFCHAGGIVAIVLQYRLGGANGFRIVA